MPEGPPRGQEKSSLTTLPPSTILIGRPWGLMFSLAGSIFKEWQRLASRSLTVTGLSLISLPSADEAPIDWPPLTPPPATRALKTRGKWSRPPVGLIAGVRPNSPIQTTRVRSSIPRRFRSAMSVASAGSVCRESVAVRSWFCWWVSQPPERTSMKVTPISTSRRASRQPWPNGLRP